MYIYIQTLCQKNGTACTKGTIPLTLNTCGMLSVNDVNFTWYAHFKYCKNYKENFFHLRQTVRNIKLVQSFGNIRFTVSKFHEFIMIRSKIANEKTHSLNHCFNFSLLWWSESQKKKIKLWSFCVYIYIYLD